ncbi:MAG: DNA gyrase subunit A [Anaerolineae bacterium]|nr:DNA gyrase subunit A [Anaerolineae bacterium]
MDVGTVQRVDIEQKMRSAYLSYAMSVITARALPDVRDGLKPVQRRILYAMYDMGLRHDQPTRKSARIVGEVLGKYHPHGDSAVYDAMVRMAQDFSMRYVLVDGQGNFGSVDGDSAAAMRYTEARLSAIGEELLIDIEKDTVDFIDNFDGSLQEPRVLPAKFPNLLVNGVGGIAVGMATNIPPHNLGEIADAIAYLVDHYNKAEDVSLDELMRFIQGPDFPTGGIILGTEGIRQAYATGKGRVIVRAQMHIEELRGGHSAIIVTELPYQVNKAGLIERIAKLVREDRLQGISDLRDESDRTGMRIVIELKRSVSPSSVLGQLLKYTQLQTTFGVNMLALVDGEPRVLSLKRALLHYIDHRYEVLTRRTRHELERAKARAHILEGLLLALDHLDEVIATIRRSRTAETARRNLQAKFKLSERQAQAILDMQLRRLAALERRKIEQEYKEVLARIEYLESLLASKKKVLALIKEDVLELKKAYGDARRTRITETGPSDEISPEDLLPKEDVVILLTREGTVRRLPASELRAGQKRIPGLSARERDVPLALLVANAQEKVAFFTNRGRAFSLPAHQLPDTAQQKRGLPIDQLARLGPAEQVISAFPLPAAPENEELFITLGTQQGKVKRLSLSELNSLTRSPLAIIGLAEGDSLLWAGISRPGEELIMVTEQGKAIRFQLDTVRPQGRTASGVRGITLKEGDAVAGIDLVREKGELVLVTAQGFAKRTQLKEYNPQGRGGQGALTIDSKKAPLTGPIVAALVALPEEEVILTTRKGTTLRLPARGIPRLARDSWGRLVTRTRKGALLQIEEGDAVDGLVLVRTQMPDISEQAPSKRGSKTKSSTSKRRKRASSAKKAPQSKQKPAASPTPEETPSEETETSTAQKKSRVRRTRRTTVTRPPKRTRTT